MYKEDLESNKLKWLICHKTKPINQIFNCVEAIAIFKRKQISSNSFKIKLPTTYSLTNHKCISI